MADESQMEDASAYAGEGLPIKDKQALSIAALNIAKAKIAEYQGSDPQIMAQMAADYATHLADYFALEDMRVNGKEGLSFHNPGNAGIIKKALFEASQGNQTKLREVLIYQAQQTHHRAGTTEIWSELDDGLKRIAATIPDNVDLTKAKPVKLAHPAFIRGKK